MQTKCALGRHSEIQYQSEDFDSLQPLSFREVLFIFCGDINTEMSANEDEWTNTRLGSSWTDAQGKKRPRSENESPSNIHLEKTWTDGTGKKRPRLEDEIQHNIDYNNCLSFLQGITSHYVSGRKPATHGGNQKEKNDLIKLRHEILHGEQ